MVKSGWKTNLKSEKKTIRKGRNKAEKRLKSFRPCHHRIQQIKTFQLSGVVSQYTKDFLRSGHEAETHHQSLVEKEAKTK